MKIIKLSFCRHENLVEKGGIYAKMWQQQLTSMESQPDKNNIDDGS